MRYRSSFRLQSVDHCLQVCQIIVDMGFSNVTCCECEQRDQNETALLVRLEQDLLRACLKAADVSIPRPQSTDGDPVTTPS